MESGFEFYLYETLFKIALFNVHHTQMEIYN